MVTMSTAVPPGLASLPATRRSILMLLKKRSEASASELAVELAITVSGVRQHVSGLLADGMVARRQEPRGPGRPTILYSLAPPGEALFPRFYSELTNELLAYVEQEDPAMLEHVFEKRRRRRERQAKERLASKDSFSQRVAELTRILDEDGYLADVTPMPDGSFLVTEHNCAILGVAQRYGLACSTEIEFLRRALPEARIERVAHKLSGAHVCSYEIRQKAKRASRVRAG
jgi:DeoR family transcriptional regulator, suf operon transcriptional repressor